MIRKASYPLLKLHCAGCAHRSEGIAAKVEGVEKASANFAAGLLYVEYDPERFRAEDLKAAIDHAGYELIIDSEDPFSEQEKQNRKNYATLRKKVLFTWILALPLLVLGMAHGWHFAGKDLILMVVGHPAYRRPRLYPQRLDSGHTTQRQYGYVGGGEHVGVFHLQPFHALLSAVLGSEKHRSPCLFRGVGHDYRLCVVG